jgi:hypothetical protein
MILRRFITLTALVVAASLSLSDRANAGYDFSTSIASVVGAATGPATGTAAFTLNGGGTITPASSQVPYTFFTDAGGSTIYLVNSSQTNAPYGINTAAALVNIYINTPNGSNDHSTWSFTATITITNPSVSQGGGGTGTFQMTAQYTMGVTSSGGTPSGTAQNTMPTSYVGSTSIFVNNNPFSVNTPTFTQVNINNATPAKIRSHQPDESGLLLYLS